MRILLLSTYHCACHRYWCEGQMAAIPEIDWTLKTQPKRILHSRQLASWLSFSWLPSTFSQPLS